MSSNSHDPLRAAIDWNEDCLRWRGRVLTGKHAHWCWDWDGLPIDETTPEWPCACCKDGACGVSTELNPPEHSEI